MTGPYTITGDHVIFEGKGVMRLLHGPDHQHSLMVINILNTHARLLMAAQGALEILRDIAVADSGHPEQDAFEREICDELQAAVTAASPVVNRYYRLYDVDQRYGGPEEGGWYYHVYIARGGVMNHPVQSRPIQCCIQASSPERLPDYFEERPTHWDGEIPQAPWDEPDGVSA